MFFFLTSLDLSECIVLHAFPYHMIQRISKIMQHGNFWQLTSQRRHPVLHMALGHCSRFGDIWHRRIQKVGSSIVLDAQEALLLESPPGVLPIIVGDQHLENFIDHTVDPSGISGGQQWKFAWGGSWRYPVKDSLSLSLFPSKKSSFHKWHSHA